MTRDTFDYILSEVRRDLTKYNFRKTISPEERLVVTLRCGVVNDVGDTWLLFASGGSGEFANVFVPTPVSSLCASSSISGMLPFESPRDTVAFKNSDILKYGHLLTFTFLSSRSNVSLIPLRFFFRSSTATNDSLDNTIGNIIHDTCKVL
ncbi:hypothetical protein PR048_029665 [Dryococelus australis]|uniref:Uncharacterized protein n=1 Tax=Dryococelus australis TaxID=614101 RepID=A0ABQ9GG08_9NEOP|nr:hypothetical protein PR048_029665 [Dryococelus australis]